MGHYNSNDKKEEVNPNCISSNDISDAVECSMKEFLQRPDVKPGDKIPGTPFVICEEMNMAPGRKVSISERIKFDYLE